MGTVQWKNEKSMNRSEQLIYWNMALTTIRWIHVSASIVTSTLPDHQLARNMNILIQDSNLTSASIVTGAFPDNQLARNMNILIQDSNLISASIVTSALPNNQLARKMNILTQDL